MTVPVTVRSPPVWIDSELLPTSSSGLAMLNDPVVRKRPPPALAVVPGPLKPLPAVELVSTLMAPDRLVRLIAPGLTASISTLPPSALPPLPLTSVPPIAATEKVVPP